MAKITVKVRKDIEATQHHIYGLLEPGKSVNIEEEDFGDELFDRPSTGWLSPLEQLDKDRAAELKERVGKHDPPVDTSVDPAIDNKDKALKGGK